MNLHVEINSNDNNYTIHVRGEIDAYTAPKLKEQVMPLAERPNTHIVVDMNEVNYLDSTGLGVFIGILKAVNKQENNTLKLIGVTDRVYRLFSITGLDDVIDLEPQNLKGAEVE